MTTAFAGTRSPQAPPTLPNGWPIGSYDTYEEAQRAVDHLAKGDFPVNDVTIVGIEPMLVERIAGKLTWSRVLTRGAMSGAWMGLFVGLLLGIFTPAPGPLPIVIGVLTGVGFGMVLAAVAYGARKGKRGFESVSQLVARRYDVLSQPRNAERGRELLSTLAVAGNPW